MKKLAIGGGVILLVVLIIWNWKHYPVFPPRSVVTTSVVPKTAFVAAATSTVSADGSSTTTLFVVARVIDGDTFELETGEKVRYIGIDTPETVDPDKPVQCYGHEASAFDKQLIEGKKVRLVADTTDKDKYGRLLRYVYLEDGTFVNLQIIQEGYARVLTIPPNLAFHTLFIQAARAAEAAKKGLWGACNYSFYES